MKLDRIEALGLKSGAIRTVDLSACEVSVLPCACPMQLPCSTLTG